jgi:hypothetical protein
MVEISLVEKSKLGELASENKRKGILVDRH